MLQNIWSEIVKYDKVIIHRHISPDPDALGSQLGLAALIKYNYPDKWVKTVGYTEASLAWMGSMDEVFDEEYEGALVFVMDTANSSRIDDYRYKLGTHIIKLDHHPVVEDYADLNYVRTDATATSEIVVRLFEANKEAYGLKMPVEAAELLYTGIIADSGRFLYDNTTKETLISTAVLYDCGIDRNKIHDSLYKRSLNIIQAQGFVLSRFKVSEQGVAYFKMTKEEQASFGLTTGTRAALVNVLANIEGIHVWVCFFENDDQRIRANIRSNGPVINTVAAEFEGGGHPKASGAMIYEWDQCEDVIEALNQACIAYFNE